MSIQKFKVGQPVWVITETSGRWAAGEVMEGQHIANLRASVRMPIRRNVFVYTVSVFGEGEFGVFENQLRPRDPDQFKAADESFDWRVKEIA